MANWKEYKLDDIVDTSRGVSYGVVQPGTFQKKDGIPILKVNNLTEGKFSIDDADKISKEVESKYARTRLTGNEILVSVVGSLGYVFKVTEKQIGWNVVRALAVLPIKENVNRDWVYYCLKSPTIQNEFVQRAMHTVQATLNLKDLREITIPVPDINTQTAIAEILASIDSKIELNNQINQNLEALAQAVFKLWFTDYEFPNERGQPYKSSGGEMTISEFGEIPVEWSVGKLGDLTKIVNGYAFKSKDFQEDGENGILKIRNVNGSVVDTKNTQFVSTDVISSIQKKFKVNSGDILIAMTGAEVGKIGIVPKTDKSLWLNQRVGRFEPISPSSSVLVHTLFNVMNLTDVVRGNAMGSAQPNISSDGIESIKCIAPAKEQIALFGNIMSENFQMVVMNLFENEKLIKLRDSILPGLISGELELNQ